MGNEAVTKFTWVIKNFTFLGPKFIESDQFVVGGCKWFLRAYPKDIWKTKVNFLCLYLVVANADRSSFPYVWGRHTKCRLTVVNQLSEELSHVKENQLWLDYRTVSMPCQEFPLTKLHEKYGGFLVNNQVKIVAEVDVLEVVGNLDVLVESQEVTQPEKKRKLEETSSVDVNGFQVLPSQAESVKRIFEKHPDMALKFQAQNKTVRTACMNVLLSLIEMLCQSLQEISIGDLDQAVNAIIFLNMSGFKVDWLELKVDDIKDKKIEAEISETGIEELEEEVKDVEALMEKKQEELKDLKKKCLDTQAMLKKEKAKVLAARVPRLTLDDVVG